MTTATPRRISFDTAAAWALTVTTVLAVLIIIPLASVPFIHTKTIVLALGALVTLVLFLLARMRGGNVSLPHLPLVGALWLVPLAYLLSTLFSGVRLESALFGSGFSADSFGIVLILAVLATLAAFILSTPERQRLYFKGLGLSFVLVLIIEVVFLLVSHLMPTLIGPTANVIGTFVDLGSFVGLGVVLALLAFRFFDIHGRKKVILSVATALGLILLTFVNSATLWALVSIVAFGLFIESVMRGHHAEGGHRSMVFPLVTLVVGIFFILGGSTIGNAVVNVVGTNYLDARPSWQSTFAVGTHTYASSPLFGTGPGSFDSQWQLHHDRSINDSIFWNLEFGSGVGHVPTSFVTTGLVGVLAWIGFFALLLFFGLRALLTRLPEERFARFVAVSSMIGALYVLLLSIFTLPGPVVLACGYILLGIFITTVRAPRTFVFSQNPRIGFVLVFVFTLLILGSIGAAYLVVERYASDLFFTSATAAVSSNDLARAEKDTVKSVNLVPSAQAYNLATVIGIARMNQIASDTKLAPADAQAQFKTTVENAISAGLSSTQIEPNNYQNWVMLGNIYANLVPLKINGAYDQAKASYQKAAELAPNQPLIPYILGQLELANNNTAAAETYFTNAVNLKHDYTNAILLLSRTEVQNGKTAEALQATEAAAYFAPNDQGVLLQVGLLRYAAGDTAGAIQALSSAIEINPQFANGRFFLGVMYAVSGDYDKALEQMQTVASFSQENADAVASDIAALKAHKNPFPTSRLAAFGIPYAPVDEPTPAGLTPVTP